MHPSRERPLSGSAADSSASTAAECLRHSVQQLQSQSLLAKSADCYWFACPALCLLQQTEASQMRAASLRQPPVEPIVVEDFAYFQVFDYDFPADTDGDNVLAGLYAGTVVSRQCKGGRERNGKGKGLWHGGGEGGGGGKGLRAVSQQQATHNTTVRSHSGESPKSLAQHAGRGGADKGSVVQPTMGGK
jgi:hypothetical protein